MDNLKACSLVAPHGRCVAFVSSLSLSRNVLVHDIRCLEDLDWERVRSIFADGFEEAGDKCSPNDLEF